MAVLPASFRTYFPDAYKQLYPNARTHLSSKVRSTLPDGSSIFEKTRSKKRRPFTEEEDRALKAGYEQHGTVWAMILKDPVFQEQNRRSTDLRDRFRNAFPELYQAAGYKPRGAPKKKTHDPSLPIRAATDDQLAMSTVSGPKRRRRAHTSQGLFRGGTKSVPQSATCSEDEDSSGGEDETEQFFKKRSTLKENTPQPELTHSSSNDVADMDLEVIDPISDSLAIPDFMHSSSQSEMTDSQSQAWSSGIDTPLHSHAWSATAGSPTSSHLSSDYLMNQSPFHRRSDMLNTIGKSAWGAQDWFSANPRLDHTSSGSSSFFDGVSPSPSSPFSFHHLNHGVLDRYDLFPTSFPHDYASEAGMGDTHSTFSDDMFPPSGFRGFTHHSNYAGDLIFGARTQQQGYYGSGSALTFGTSGLGLSGIQQQPVGIHPSQLHTPALPGIDEIELTGINLNDEEILLEPLNAAVEVASSVGVVGMPEEDGMPSVAECTSFGVQALKELVGMSHDELHDTPPCTPITQTRSLRTSLFDMPPASTHPRSVSVPPSEARSAASWSALNRDSNIADVDPSPQAQTASPMPALIHPIPLFQSLSHTNDITSHHAHLPSPHHNQPQPQQHQQHEHHHHPALQSFASPSSYSDEIRTAQAELYNLPFLDLHYYSSTPGHGTAHIGGGGGAPGIGLFDFGSSKSESQPHHRQDQVLDLAQPVVLSSRSHVHASASANGLRSFGGGGDLVAKAMAQRSRISATRPPPVTVNRSHSLHQRGQSAISPQDLLFRKASDNKRKRASWDGGAS